eukprot:scaffold382_cov380-Prasinococcus_capsulatus_cf.AAC.44
MHYSSQVLRKWLFEHFLHPFPTHQQKQELAHASGLGFAQVANWFINARVRIWKPMIAKVTISDTPAGGLRTTLGSYR